ncbi:discoidin domain-containing protein [Roseospira visakhapatnamensis]|uniref:F5/8 type C domain-containing protein n=1 Tax=Roseospira visakhapatnamensis TaxID=390880 RepID=A0A7W6RGD2_9PROT|nr:discoidin domain-containing protein [Roseospira visakhapatnamensis]MBB4268076.1 hypothetical protein [Roseospira visakhapatnamensis]
MLAQAAMRLAAAGGAGQALVIPWENPAMTYWNAPAPYKVLTKSWETYPSWQAFDKNPNTYVMSRQGVPGNPNWWITLDCGAPKRVTELTFTVVDGAYRPKNVTLFTSVDDVTWTLQVVGRIEPEPAEGSSRTTMFGGDGTTARLWRFNCGKVYADHRRTMIAEIILRGFE